MAPAPCRRLAVLQLALQLAARGGDSTLIPVEARGYEGDGWTASSAGCSTAGGTCRPVVYDDIEAAVGDTLVFRYGWWHDVFMSSLADVNCDFGSGRVVGSGGAGAGAAGFQYQLTEPGSFVFSCSRSGNRPG
eukprot:SAG22_NODE_252_length_13679_cov_74.486524_4_plen_133_part_00